MDKMLFSQGATTDGPFRLNTSYEFVDLEKESLIIDIDSDSNCFNKF